MSRKVLTSCVIILVVACLILSVIGIYYTITVLSRNRKPDLISGTPGSEISQSEPAITISEDKPTVVPTSTSETESLAPTPTSIPEPTPTDVIDPLILSQLVLIEQQVSEERGLYLNGSVSRNIYSDDQLKTYIFEDFAAEYTSEEAFTDTITLSALGLIDIEFDLYSYYLDLLSEQIAGFYDDELKEMVIVQSDDFSGPEKLTYAHEFTHALQDSAYDIKNGLKFNDKTCDQDTERCAAIQALIEGDATFSELNWFILNASPDDRISIMDFLNTYESPILESGPGFIQKDLLFPYETGFTFVEYFFTNGGWPVVDNLYSDPPVSTEQILHPEKYPSDKPISVSLPIFTDVLDGEWQEMDRNVLGEWYTYLVLAYGLLEDHRIADDRALQAASGWGGDEYIVLWNPGTEQYMLVLKTLWDSENDANEYEDALTRYINRRTGNKPSTEGKYKLWESTDYVHGVSITGNLTIWIVTPDEAILQILVQAMSNHP